MKNYRVLKGKAKQFLRDSDSDPHSELLVAAAGTKYRVAINVRSSRGPTQQRLVEYAIVDDVKGEVVDRAKALPEGLSDLRDGVDDGAAIDYIRSNLFRAEQLKPLVHEKTGPDNDLFEKVEALLGRAIDDPRAVVYAFGESWGPERNQPDQYFHFEPGNGIHDIHMNQGNQNDQNAVFQDGALLVEFPASGSTVGLFIKFQNQSWHTNDVTGDPLSDAPTPSTPPGPGPWDPVPPNSPYRLAKLIGALINPAGDDVGGELVTVFNTSPGKLDLTGWKIVDKQGRAESLAGSIALGEARTFRLSGTGAQLSNQGGSISLLDASGLKVDGVAYSKADAARQGAAQAF